MLGGAAEGDQGKGQCSVSLCGTPSAQIPWEKDSPLQELMVLAQGVPSLV